MTYNLEFTPSALDDWKHLDNSIKQLFKKGLSRRLEQPRVPSARLSQLPLECYKIKLKQVGYRLIYTIEDDCLVLMVLVAARRDAVYKKLAERINSITPH